MTTSYCTIFTVIGVGLFAITLNEFFNDRLLHISIGIILLIIDFITIEVLRFSEYYRSDINE
jgi:hypothetical protein